MTTLDDTRHCPMCEDAAKKILELEQRVKVLTDALKIARHMLKPEESETIESALSSTPQQTAAQIERGHIEWMMKLPVAAVGCTDMAKDGKCSPVAWLNSYPQDGEVLVKIPPLPKESKE